MLDSATKDVADATAAAKSSTQNAATLGVIASVRKQQAAALLAEVNRAAAVTTTSTPPTTSAGRKGADEGTVTAQLMQDMKSAQQQAAALLPKLPRYRAGLVGSVAAGCASLTEALNSTPITQASALTVAPAATAASASATTGTGTTSAPTASGPPLPPDSADALQAALSTEHAALWLYGTASAFMRGTAVTEIIAAMDSVQVLRDTAERRLTAGGVTPQTAQAAYLVPIPVTNQASALTALGIAEADATVAWRAVLERTDNASLRTVALDGLIDSAVRQTRWRRLSGQSPASVAMPGRSA